MHRLSLLLALLAPAWAQPAPSLRGTVTDPSGAVVAGAVIQLRGPAREQRATTDHTGQYAFPSLVPGKYQVRITAKGFSAAQKKDFDIAAPPDSRRPTGDPRRSAGNHRGGRTSLRLRGAGGERQPRGPARAPTRGPLGRSRGTRVTTAGAGRSGPRSRTAASSSSTASPAAACPRSPPSARCASMPTRSPPSTTAPVSRASRSSPNPAATSSAARPSRSTTTSS